MDTVNMHEAKTHLSRLIDRVINGTGFIIAKSGKPVAKVMPLGTPEASETKRLGFLKGQFHVPADFDRMGEEEIGAIFGDHP